MNNHAKSIFVNLAAVLFLISLISLPFYFAQNFSQVSGVKSTTPYLLVSQVEKFPGMHLSQIGTRYEISFEYQYSEASVSLLPVRL